ncbi:EAL domain-containing protein [Desulfovibrio sp. OttesenSCG-928-A18]|nr:EAL domain-containing protein [Desulfovibrio sp. OttesenSCG-928-A18]
MGDKSFMGHVPYAPGSAGHDGFGLLTLHEAPLLRAFRHGVMLAMPLLLAAAIGLLVNNFPLQIYQDFMLAFFGPRWKEPAALLFNSTIEILALATTYTISDSLMSLHNQRHPDRMVLPAMGVITALSCLFIMMGLQNSGSGLLIPWAGIRGLFGSLVITLCSCSLFLVLCRIKRLRLPYYSEGADPILPHMFDSLLPVLLTLGCFVIFREVLLHFGIRSLHEAFFNAIRVPFQEVNDSFGMAALYAFLVQVCWFFGIHGADLLDPITHQVLLKGMEANSLAVNNQLPPPHIFTKYFFDVYIYMGGAGTTLGLLAAIFLRGKDRGTRRVAKISILPVLFNINELLIFGLPIVLNPAFLIPFLFTPLVLVIISYLAVSWGLAPMPIFQVDWTTPPIASALISTGSWKGVVMQCVNLCVATGIYLPFVSLADEGKMRSRRKAFKQLVRIAASGIRGPGGKRCTDRPGSAGALARSLVNDMRSSLDRQDGDIVLHYQPRVDFVHKTVPCVEALLRWEHPFYGSIPPQLTFAIAHDAGLTARLDNRVMQMVFEQQFEWRSDKVFTTVAFNVSEDQLKDRSFPATLNSLYVRYSLPSDAIMLEISESLALDPESRYNDALKALHSIGAIIAVDDFGKSYLAMSQIKRLPLAEVQVDRNLVHDIAYSRNSQDVTGTIQEMCLKLGIRTSAEYVESQEQLETLLELNFSSFQGHYFSKPISAEACKEFMARFTGSGR